MLHLIERIDSRESSGGSKTFHYRLTGTSDDLLAKTTLLSSTPTTYDGLVREQDPSIDPVWVDTDSGGGEWDCTVRYDPPELVESEIGAVAITGTTQGGTQHITQSLSNYRVVAPGETVPDLNGAIGVTGTSVEGVDIIVPVWHYTVRKVFDTDPDGTPQPPALAALYALTGKTNNGEFSVTDSRTGLTMTCAVGECLFLGAEFGGQRTDGGIEFVFGFAASPNMTGIVIGDCPAISKDGWEYLWVKYESREDAPAKALVMRPIAVYVEEVYKKGDFGPLGVGNTKT